MVYPQQFIVWTPAQDSTNPFVILSVSSPPSSPSFQMHPCKKTWVLPTDTRTYLPKTKQENTTKCSMLLMVKPSKHEYSNKFFSLTIQNWMPSLPPLDTTICRSLPIEIFQNMYKPSDIPMTAFRDDIQKRRGHHSKHSPDADSQIQKRFWLPPCPAPLITKCCVEQQEAVNSLIIVHMLYDIDLLSSCIRIPCDNTWIFSNNVLYCVLIQHIFSYWKSTWRCAVQSKIVDKVLWIDLIQ